MDKHYLERQLRTENFNNKKTETLARNCKVKKTQKHYFTSNRLNSEYNISLDIGSNKAFGGNERTHFISLSFRYSVAL